MKTIEPPKPRRADLRVVVDQHEEQRQQAIEALQRAKERIANDAGVIAQQAAAITQRDKAILGFIVLSVVSVLGNILQAVLA